jgi:hypothetical protein
MAEIKIGVNVQDQSELQQLEKRLDALRQRIAVAEPAKLRDIRITQDQEEAYIQLSRRLESMSPIDARRVRISKDQHEWLQKWNSERKTELNRETESLRVRKERIEIDKRYNDEMKSEAFKGIEARQKQLNIEQKHADILDQRLEQISRMRGGEKGDGAGEYAKQAAGGLMQGFGLGGIMGRVSGPLVMAYATYKMAQFVSRGMTEAGNVASNLDKLNLLTGEEVKSATASIPTLRARSMAMGVGLKQAIELTKYTAETIDYTQENNDLMDQIGKSLRNRGRDVSAELPAIMEMARRSPGRQVSGNIIGTMEAIARRSGIASERLFSQFLPMAQAYQDVLFRRGISMSAEDAAAVAGGIASKGEPFRGEQGAQIMASLSQVFSAGGGAGEPGQALIYRALMGKGMGYYDIQKALSSGEYHKYLPDIMKQVGLEYGSVAPGTQGLLAMQRLFPNLSIRQWEDIVSKTKPGEVPMSPIREKIDEDREYIRGSRYADTRLDIETRNQIERELAVVNVAEGIGRWWSMAKGDIVGMLNVGLGNRQVGENDRLNLYNPFYHMDHIMHMIQSGSTIKKTNEGQN